MRKYELNLLDCTLRDGGYINNWEWGKKAAREIINMLVKAKVDIVEVGFLRNNVKDATQTIGKNIKTLNSFLPNESQGTIFAAMAMQSNYDVENLEDYSGKGISLIRITAHDYDLQEGLLFAKKVQEKGYKVSINPINIMGYSDKQILHMVEQVNTINPYQFSIVDTFGSMRVNDLDRIVSIIHNNLNGNVRVGLHLHENMALSFCLAQKLVEKHLKRDITIDGSLLGMGRIPGNLPIELMADYLNENFGKYYAIDYLMDAIYDYIQPIKEQCNWGYSTEYFLSAKFNLHRNYSEYFLGKGNLTTADINRLLSRISREKATVFDVEYADEIYHNYMNNEIDDSAAIADLKSILLDKKILLLAPGKSIVDEKDKIKEFIDKENLIVITINFIPEQYESDFAFFSNHIRLDRISNKKNKIIATSNLEDKRIDYLVNYNEIVSDSEQECNSLIMMLNLLYKIGISQVFIAGADGYEDENENYFDSAMRSLRKHAGDYSETVGKMIKKIGIDVEFLTKSAYEHYC